MWFVFQHKWIRTVAISTDFSLEKKINIKKSIYKSNNKNQNVQFVFINNLRMVFCAFR